MQNINMPPNRISPNVDVRVAFPEFLLVQWPSKDGRVWIFTQKMDVVAFGPPGPRRNIAVRFGTEKLEWWVYEMVKKIVSTQYTNVTDTGQTDAAKRRRLRLQRG